MTTINLGAAWWPTAPLLAMGLALFGCADSVPGPLGAACDDKSECANGLCLQESQYGQALGWTGGYCTAACTTSCAAGGKCVQIGEEGRCLVTCERQSACRQGYICDPIGGVCLPDCNNGFQCGVGLYCQAEGNCSTAPNGSGGTPVDAGGAPMDASAHDAGHSKSDGSAKRHADAAGRAPCKVDADCAGVCPPGTTTCACKTTPGGQRCVSLCQSKADCPAVDGKSAFCNGLGFCVSSGGSGGGGGGGGGKGG